MGPICMTDRPLLPVTRVAMPEANPRVKSLALAEGSG
jgi:hypothetical protein